jgi:hypothetical protein
MIQYSLLNSESIAPNTIYNLTSTVPKVSIS